MVVGEFCCNAAYIVYRIAAGKEHMMETMKRCKRQNGEGAKESFASSNKRLFSRPHYHVRTLWLEAKWRGAEPRALESQTHSDPGPLLLEQEHVWVHGTPLNTSRYLPHRTGVSGVTIAVASGVWHPSQKDFLLNNLRLMFSWYPFLQFYIETKVRVQSVTVNRNR